MRTRSSRPGRITAACAAYLVGLGLFAAPPAAANPAGTGLVINEVYLNGGSAGATYANKFLELANPTPAAIDLDGSSLQYRAAAPTSQFSVVEALSGVVPAYGTFLIQGGSNGANGAALPTPDLITTFNPSGTAGAVAIVQGTTALTGVDSSVTGNPAVVDLVGWGSTAKSYETDPVAGSTNSVVASLNRTAAADTDRNSTDFSAATPSPASGCTAGPDPIQATIAEIQGTGTASPYACAVVTTTGVVTAAYPTGGFSGFYLQTGGSGGNDPDLTPGASDAIFVFGSATAGAVQIGESVQVTGKVSEFRGLTELTPRSAVDVSATAPLPPVKSIDTDLPPTASGREALEGMLLHPTGRYTVTDTFSLNNFASIGLAFGDEPLKVPTEVAAPQSAEAAAVAADNAARRVVLDDGASINFLGADASKDIPLPWLTDLGPVRVGDPTTFTADVILDYRNRAWTFEPVEQLTAGDENGVRPAVFTPTRPAAPEPVGGDVRLGTFNVLNYFTTTGEAFEAAHADDQPPIDCTGFLDRDDNPITVNACDGDAGPRGAWDDANLARQQSKIVRAINALGANVVSLEEVENSAKFGIDRDTALAALVAALNAEAGAGTWDYVRSPEASQLPPLADQDVIRTAFIYQPAVVKPSGPSTVLLGSAAFGNAREPLAQAFSPVNGRATDTFLVIVNHFKSKGSGADDGTGQGLANPDRVAQAGDLIAFATTMEGVYQTDRVFLTGDFNAYSMETPVQVIKDAGFVDVEREFTDKDTYSFGGESGSLDHVFASPAIEKDDAVTGLDVWQINAPESVAYEYSRYNYNVTPFYTDDPYRASDHDPVVLGIDVTEKAASSVVAIAVPVVVRVGQSLSVYGFVAARDAGPITGFVEIRHAGAVVGSAQVVNGFFRIPVSGLAGRGLALLDVSYSGSGSIAPSRALTPVWVR